MRTNALTLKIKKFRDTAPDLHTRGEDYDDCPHGRTGASLAHNFQSLDRLQFLPSALNLLRASRRRSTLE